MLSTAWTAPARVAGRDGFAMPAGDAVFAVQGSGVSEAGAAVRLRPVAGDAKRVSQQLQCTTPITQNDGTTLGSHPPRRPLS
jgi:hypothetical protein